jgi:hypothetical protein
MDGMILAPGVTQADAVALSERIAEVDGDHGVDRVDGDRVTYTRPGGGRRTRRWRRSGGRAELGGLVEPPRAHGRAAPARSGFLAAEEYRDESPEARRYRLWYREKLEREARARELMAGPAVRAAAGGPDPSDYAPFPADPWPNSEVYVPVPIERPARVLAAEDYHPCPEPDWGAMARRQDGGGSPARREHRAAASDDGFVPCPRSPWE